MGAAPPRSNPVSSLISHARSYSYVSSLSTMFTSCYKQKLTRPYFSHESLFMLNVLRKYRAFKRA